MPPDKPSHSTPASKDECYLFITEYTLNSMRLRKTGDRIAYPEEINKLANVCANLLKRYSETEQALVNRMEQIMRQQHEKEIQSIDKEIKTLFNKRKLATPGTLYGEKDIMILTAQINELEKRKHTCMKEIVEGVICDTFEQIANNHGWNICQNFIVTEYEYHENPSCPISKKSELNPHPPIGKNLN